MSPTPNSSFTEPLPLLAGCSARLSRTSLLVLQRECHCFPQTSRLILLSSPHTSQTLPHLDQAHILIRAVLVAKNRQILLRLAQGKDAREPHGTPRTASIHGDGSPTFLSWAELVGHPCSYSDGCDTSYNTTASAAWTPQS